MLKGGRTRFRGANPTAIARITPALAPGKKRRGMHRLGGGCEEVSDGYRSSATDVFIFANRWYDSVSHLPFSF